jgi:hypothetical protein
VTKPKNKTMKATFSTKDPNEIIILSKANDMQSFIFELVNNGWREFKHIDYDYRPAWKKINELIEEYNLEELIDM